MYELLSSTCRTAALLFCRILHVFGILPAVCCVGPADGVQPLRPRALPDKHYKTTGYETGRLTSNMLLAHNDVM